jgi:hypothetical protein
MTSDEPRPLEPEPLAGAPDASSKALPFEYEDLSDGRHLRLIEEIRAARAWSLRRRAMGLRPN